MTSSHGRIDDTQRGIIAQSYKQSPVDDGLVEVGWFEYSAADGGVVSTVDDLSTYARFILNRGETPGGRLFGWAPCGVHPSATRIGRFFAGA